MMGPADLARVAVRWRIPRLFSAFTAETDRFEAAVYPKLCVRCLGSTVSMARTPEPMTATSLETVPQSRALVRPPEWLLLAAGTCVLVMIMGSYVLLDTDTLWQIKVGEWILANHAVPRVDIYSLTKAGEPWMSSSWLAQVLFAAAYAIAGWTGVALLAALGVAATVAVLVRALEKRLPTAYAAFVATIAFALSAQHILARPHLLAMPVMVAWVAGLMSASDRGVKPSFWLLPLLALWANLHGGFVLGFALVAPIALDAVWGAAPGQRKTIALHWALFGPGALIACGLTPYGWGVLFAARKILGLGEILVLISEWAPVSFAGFHPFEGCLLALIGLGLYVGIKLPPTRILLSLGLLHMALGHVRNIEVFALLLPLVLMAPLADRFGAALVRPRANAHSTLAGIALLMVTAVVVGAVAFARPIRPPFEDKGEAAIQALRATGAKRVFNEYGVGGQMIWAGMRPFIDGRAELYGGAYALDYFKAVSLRDPEVLFRLLKSYDIDATVLDPDVPAVRVMDRLDGWKRVFTSDFAVIHVRTPAEGGEPPRAGASSSPR